MRELITPADERLLTFRKVCELPTADPVHLNELRDFINRQNGEFCQGLHAKTYEELTEEDLTSLTAQTDPDLFMRFANGPIISWFHNMMYGKNSQRTIKVPRIVETNTQRTWDFYFEKYSPERSALLSRFMVSVTTAGLITLAIVLLNYIQRANFRIVLIFFLNLFFSVVMAVLARARAAEVFAISAAYAAVLVVYASGPSGLFGQPSS